MKLHFMDYAASERTQSSKLLALIIINRINIGNRGCRSIHDKPVIRRGAPITL